MVEANVAKRNYLLYFIACFFVIIGAIGLIVTNTGNNTRGGGDDESENPSTPPENEQVPPFNPAPEFPLPTFPTTFNDPDSEVVENFIDVDGRRRRFKVFVPGVYARNPTNVPLVFVFHGSLGTAEAIQGSYGMDEVAETENFLAVYAAGEGRNFEVFTLENNKDIDFTLAMIDFMKAEYMIREESIYSTGYSNGGFLSTMLACVHPDIFAAVAPMAGTFDTGVFPDCSPSETIPFLQIHGSNDNIVPYNGNRQIVSVDETLAFWATANGQVTTPVIGEEEPGFELHSYPPANIVQHYRMLGIGHLNVIDSFPAQKIINFFKRVSNFNRFILPAPPAPFNDADSEVLERFIDVNGRRRRFKIFVPGSYARNPTAVPLVFVFHGSLGTAEAIQGSYGMDAVAETENFIAVYPAGENRNFEVFTLENNKDLDFALGMIDFMKAEFQIKENSIYSTGYSNGGFLSTMLACAHSDIFAAVAPMASTFDTGVFPECAPSQTIPYLQIHGSNDSIVPYNGNRNIVSVEDTLAFWTAANGQSSTPVVTEEEDGELFTFPPNNIVRHYLLNGVGHFNVIDSFPAQTIIDFFKSVSDF